MAAPNPTVRLGWSHHHTPGSACLELQWFLLVKCCLPSAAVVPDWPDSTHIEVSHSLFVGPKLLLLWSFPLSSPQQAWFSGILWQASDKFPSPRGSVHKQNQEEHTLPVSPQHTEKIIGSLLPSQCHLQNLVYNTVFLMLLNIKSQAYSFFLIRGNEPLLSMTLPIVYKEVKDQGKDSLCLLFKMDGHCQNAFAPSSSSILGIRTSYKSFGVSPISWMVNIQRYICHPLHMTPNLSLQRTLTDCKLGFRVEMNHTI